MEFWFARATIKQWDFLANIPALAMTRQLDALANIPALAMTRQLDALANIPALAIARQLSALADPAFAMAHIGSRYASSQTEANGPLDRDQARLIVGMF